MALRNGGPELVGGDIGVAQIEGGEVGADGEDGGEVVGGEVAEAGEAGEGGGGGGEGRLQLGGVGLGGGGGGGAEGAGAEVGEQRGARQEAAELADGDVLVDAQAAEARGAGHERLQGVEADGEGDALEGEGFEGGGGGGEAGHPVHGVVLVVVGEVVVDEVQHAELPACCGTN